MNFHDVPRARFDTGLALTDDQLRKTAPSVFATTAHESRSGRFCPIPTIEVLRALAKEGFVAVGAKQSVAKSCDRKPFAKHLIRLRRVDEARSHQVGDVVAEMLLKNANDGSSAYELLAGLFRIRCLNSLVADLGAIDAIKVRHSGDVVRDVIEGTFRVCNDSEKALVAPERWGRLQLAPPERSAFAEAAHVLRFADSEGNVSTPVKPEQLLVPKRVGDEKPDLWTTFNVVQENAMRGGISARAGVRLRRSTTRPINGIDQDVKLNKALWVLTQKLAEAKGCAL